MQNRYEIYYRRLFKKKIFKEIINTNIFKRLMKINFIGIYPYIFQKEKQLFLKNNRYKHSINVAVLMNYFLENNNLNINKKEKKTILVASILHDIGHFIFSHSSEDYFKKYFNINHIQNTIDIINNNKELNKIFLKYHIDKDEILFLLQKNKEKEKDNKYYLLHFPFNMDIIEGTFRTYYCCINNKKLDFNEFDVINGIKEKNLKILDKFWELRNIIQENLINTNLFKITDYLTFNYFQIKQIQKNTNLLTDLKFINKYDILENIKRRINYSVIKITSKKINYIVNKKIKDINFKDINSIFKRYNVKKELKEFDNFDYY